MKTVSNWSKENVVEMLGVMYTLIENDDFVSRDPKLAVRVGVLVGRLTEKFIQGDVVADDDKRLPRFTSLSVGELVKRLDDLEMIGLLDDSKPGNSRWRSLLLDK